MKPFQDFFIAVGLVALLGGLAYAFNTNPAYRQGGDQEYSPGESRYDYLMEYCRGEGIIDEGCSFELLRPIEWRFRYFHPQAQVGECQYMCAAPDQYCQGVYKNSRVGYLCGAQ